MILNNRLISAIRGVWYLTSLSTIFQLYHGGQFYWLRKSRVPGENQPASNTPRLSGIQTHNVSGDRH